MSEQTINDSSNVNESIDIQNKFIEELIAPLESDIEKVSMIIEQINNLKYHGNFDYLSKTAKNFLLNNLLDSSRMIEERSKVLFRVLKKSKRLRAPDNILDHLLYVHIPAREYTKEVELKDDDQDTQS